MAKIELGQMDEYVARLSLLAGEAQEKIAGTAIGAGAGIVADAIRAGLEANLGDPESVSRNPKILFKNFYHEPSGELLASFGISPMKMDSNGDHNVKIGFDGYDSKGVSNQLKARIMESGISKIKKRPFVRPAVTATTEEALNTMREKVDDGIAQIMNK